VAERVLLILLCLIGFWGIIAKKNIIKKIFGLYILNSAVVILFVVEGARIGENAPIMAEGVSHVADPLPQALMLTAIVIGVCITSLALAIAFRLYRFANTFDIDEIRRKIRHAST